MSVEPGETHVLTPSQAVLSDLAGLPPDLQRSTEAATALALAEELERGRAQSSAAVAKERGRAQSSAAVAKELVVLMQMLRDKANQTDAQDDPLEQLAAVRKLRLAGDR